MGADDLSRIAMSSNLSVTLARGADFAREQGHYEVRLEHMLLSLCEDPDAALVLAASNIDLERLRAEVMNFLAQLEQMPAGQDGTPAVSADLRRILDAAAAAARGGRRREINGAIVLAAVVGDGKSPAAQMMREQGLTFEGAIRALQGSPKPARQGRASAEDILADARARVQSRTAPPRQLAYEEPEEEEPEPEPEPEPQPEPAPAPEERDEPVEMYEEPPPPDAMNVEMGPPPEPEPEPEPEPQPAPPPPPEPPRERLIDRLQRSEPEPGTPGGPYGRSQEAPPETWEQAAPPYEEEGGISSLDDDMDAYGVEEETGPPDLPASAPFPPPLPVPEASWMPPPGTDHMPPSPPGYGAPPGQEVPPGFGAPPPLPQSDAFGAGGQPESSAGEDMAGPSFSGAPPWSDPDELRGPPTGPSLGIPQDRGGENLGPLMSRTRGMQPGARPSTGAGPGHFGRSGPTPRAEIGQLVENIPRIMRVAVPSLVEVRIAKADVQAVAEGLQGGGAAFHHKVSITKAMSVRLRAPDGGFFIEMASPETQWIERSTLMSGEEYASWRWHVTPREKGRKRLQLVISARTVGGDGMTAETALPDQVVTVRVRTNYGKTFWRWTGWIAAAIVGGLLARFGEGTFDALKEVLTQLFAN